MPQLKVALLTVRADHGGGPRHVDLLLNNFSSHIAAYVICPQDDPYYRKWLNNPKVLDILEVPHRKFSLKRLRAIKSFLVENEITILHSHGKGAGLYSRFIKVLLPNIKVIHTFHGVHTMEYTNVQKRIYIAYERIAKALTDKFINVSEGEKEICLANKICDPYKQKTIYNGVGRSETELALLHDCQDKFLVVSITRFDYSKNMQLAYEVAKHLRDKEHIKFIWIGDGPDKMQIEAKALEEGLRNIIFTGFKESPESYLAQAHICFSSSRWEGLPIALVEATSFGLPIVATDVTGNNEVVQHNQNGFLYNIKEPAEAAAYIWRLSEDPELYTKLSHNSAKSYHALFTVDKMVSETEQVYTSPYLNNQA